jgi:tetratricopeptide (TPR) repeat protein
MEAFGSRSWQPWFRLHLAERDFAEALKTVDRLRKTDKATASYCAALVYLKQGDAARALPEVEVVQEAQRNRKNDRGLELRLWEVQGLYQCQTGDAEAGLKLLQKAVERTKSDYSHHAWGNGAQYMEAWGVAALGAGKGAVAEEAYLEALAHDPGSVRAALGMQVLCEGQGRTEEAARFAELAKRCWAKADSGRLEVELSALRALRQGASRAGAGDAR